MRQGVHHNLTAEFNDTQPVSRFQFKTAIFQNTKIKMHTCTGGEPQNLTPPWFRKCNSLKRGKGLRVTEKPLIARQSFHMEPVTKKEINSLVF